MLLTVKMPNSSPTAVPVANAPAMLLAAGRGERMRPLTDACPKPLLEVHGQALLQWHLQALARAGVARVVVNTAWLGEQISQRFGRVFVLQPNQDKRQQRSKTMSLQIDYSHEGRDFGGALETAGGICRALPQLCPQPEAPAGDLFWLVAGDVFTPGFEFSAAALARFAAGLALAHLWLVPNPAHNPRGDFGLDAATGLALNLKAADPRPRWTYSTMGLYRAALFAPPWCDIAPGNPQGIKTALAPLLRAAMDHGRVTAELYQGPWADVGTAQRLAELNR